MDNVYYSLAGATLHNRSTATPPQRNLTNSKEKSKILITMQKHAYYRFFQKEIIIKIRRSEDGPK